MLTMLLILTLLGTLPLWPYSARWRMVLAEIRV
jgi:hypothetical protein